MVLILSSHELSLARSTTARRIKNTAPIIIHSIRNILAGPLSAAGLDGTIRRIMNRRPKSMPAAASARTSRSLPIRHVFRQT